MLSRICWRIVLAFPACRAVRQGMLDGLDGLLPRSAAYYYLEGHRVGTGLRTAG